MLVPEETFTHLHPWGRRKICTDNKVCFESARVLYNQSRPDGPFKLTVSAFNGLWISMPAVVVTVSKLVSVFLCRYISEVTERRVHASWKVSPQLSLEQSIGDVRIMPLDWNRIPQVRSRNWKSSVTITTECTYSTYCYAKLTESFINLLHYCSSSSGLYGAEKDNRGRRTNNAYGRNPIRTIGAPTSIIPHFYAECPFCATLLTYPGLGQAPNNAGLHTCWLGQLTLMIAIRATLVK